jgi:hypothetical protein
LDESILPAPFHAAALLLPALLLLQADGPNSSCRYARKVQVCAGSGDIEDGAAFCVPADGALLASCAAAACHG